MGIIPFKKTNNIIASGDFTSPQYLYSQSSHILAYSGMLCAEATHQSTLGDVNMHSTAHINSLTQKHAALDKKIHSEEIRPVPDSMILHELKKEKLVLKDEMTRLSTQ